MGVIPNMSRKDNPYDNARMESFYKTLKSEEVIPDLYNRERLNSSLGYVPPNEFAAHYYSA